MNIGRGGATPAQASTGRRSPSMPTRGPAGRARCTSHLSRPIHHRRAPPPARRPAIVLVVRFAESDLGHLRGRHARRERASGELGRVRRPSHQGGQSGRAADESNVKLQAQNGRRSREAGLADYAGELQARVDAPHRGPRQHAVAEQSRRRQRRPALRSPTASPAPFPLRRTLGWRRMGKTDPAQRHAAGFDRGKSPCDLGARPLRGSTTASQTATRTRLVTTRCSRPRESSSRSRSTL